jgi:hypothetical protein
MIIWVCDGRCPDSEVRPIMRHVQCELRNQGNPSNDISIVWPLDLKFLLEQASQ